MPQDRPSIADAVLDAMLSRYGLSHPRGILPWLASPQAPRQFDLREPGDLADAAAVLRSPIGRIRFRIDLEDRESDVHPMVRALRNANDVLALGQEVEHPLEHDDRDQERRYSSVVTVRAVPSAGIALSTGRLPLHQDGVGTEGSVRFIAMCLDRGPVSGGGQFYANLLAHGLLLAYRNWHRFVDATQADALTVTRFSGSQAASVTGPMFYVDETGMAAAHFRANGGEYEARPNPRVAAWFEEFSRSLAQSAESEAVSPGDCLVVDNLSVAHARSAFTESDATPRRLSRKWYAIASSRANVWNRPSFRLNRAVYHRQD
jgi:hypothetical protein